MVIRRIPDPTLQQPIKPQFKQPEPKSQLKSILSKIQQPREKPIEKPAPIKPKPIPVPEPSPEPEDDDDLTHLDHIPDIGKPMEFDEGGFAKAETQRYIQKPRTPVERPKPSYELFEEAQQLRRESTIVKHETIQEAAEKQSIPFKNVIGTVIGIALLVFGIWNSGGFYETSSRLSGELAVFFYVWQIGNLLQIAGAITIYHNIQKLTIYIKGRLSIGGTDESGSG